MKYCVRYMKYCIRWHTVLDTWNTVSYMKYCVRYRRTKIGTLLWPFLLHTLRCWYFQNPSVHPDSLIKNTHVLCITALMVLLGLVLHFLVCVRLYKVFYSCIGFCPTSYSFCHVPQCLLCILCVSVLTIDLSSSRISKVSLFPYE